MTRTLELNAAFEPRRFDFPVWFLKGGWSQYNLAYAGQTQAMGWDVWLPKLTLSVIPGTHSSMYEGTALHAFARELQMTLSKQ